MYKVEITLHMLLVQPRPYCALNEPASEGQPTIEALALRIFGELALSLSLGAVYAVFTATPIALVGGIAAQCVLNTALRITLFLYQKPLDNWVTALIFSIGSLHNLNIVLHETGHVLATEALLQNPASKIALFPYIGGNTSFRVSKPSALGVRLGLDNIHPLIAGAGPAFSLGLSTVQLHLGLKHSSPVLITASLTNFVFHAITAIYAFFTSVKNVGNDFVVLKLAGLPPLVAGVAILAIPILLFTTKGY